MQRTFRHGAMLALTVLLAACASSIKKSDIAATANPADEIKRLEGEYNAGLAEQLDVLASPEFSEGQSYLDEARRDLAKGEKQSEILDDVAYSDAYLKEARHKAEGRRGEIAGILEAREKAVAAGARQYPPTRKRLKSLDDDLRGEAKKFAKLDADKVAKIQRSYMDLEMNAILAKQLGGAKAAITGARDRKAYSYTPAALKRADVAYATAENAVRANRNDESTYADAVQNARHEALLLTKTLAATKGGKVDEGTASALVAKDLQIARLKDDLSDANTESEAMSDALQAQGRKLARAGAAVSLQQSLEDARKEFGKDEAEVFQQGDKLLIRLKSMNFASGRAELPAEALPILAKVRDVAQELGPQRVTVEGHTDSTGSKAINRKLSQERATAVADYLGNNGIGEEKVNAVGYGFEKPIASNKSRTGRMQNRRVDIVITPASSVQ